MNSLKISTLVLLLVLKCTVSVLAQSLQKHTKTSYVDSLQNYYQHPDQPVYLFIANSLDDNKPTPLREITGETIKPIYLDGPGVHLLRHMDNIHHKIDVFKIHADDKSPVTTLTAAQIPSYKTKEGKQYFGKNFTINLSAKDDMSGIKQSYLSTNAEDYQSYTTQQSFNNEGDYSLSFYSVDNVGNGETPTKYNFTIDLEAPKTFHNIVGITSGKVISTSSILYLTSEDKGSGVKETYYSFNDEPARLLKGKDINFKYLPNGEHTIYYRSVDKVDNAEEKQSFTFFLDKVAPIASMDILGDKFVVNDKIYFSGRTKVKLTAVDNRTGVKELKYSIDDKIFQNYDEPFYMPSKAGLYSIKFYAVDESNNMSEGEGTHSRGVVYVDLVGPTLQFKLDGPTFRKGQVMYIGAKTKFGITAKDGESGLQYLAYRINNDDEQRYEKPFQLNKPDGEYKITYIGYDNVNNRNQGETSVMLDSEGPEIRCRFSSEPSEGTKTYPSYVQIYLSATDTKTTSSVIKYSLNDSAEQIYTLPLKGFKPNTEYKLKVKGKDVLENETEVEFDFKIDEY